MSLQANTNRITSKRVKMMKANQHHLLRPASPRQVAITRPDPAKEGAQTQKTSTSMRCHFTELTYRLHLIVNPKQELQAAVAILQHATEASPEFRIRGHQADVPVLPMNLSTGPSHALKIPQMEHLQSHGSSILIRIAWKITVFFKSFHVTKLRMLATNTRCWSFVGRLR
jgi:hypothetical protein